MVVSFCALGALWAQSQQSYKQSLEGAAITKLSPPIYPPLARQARITGDVVVRLEVRPDGSVVSATVISGHPLLIAAALDNAQHSQFLCNDCGEEVHSYRLVYTFELNPSNGCADLDDKSKPSQEQSYPRVTQSPGRVAIVDRPMIICDPSGYTKVRSIKCLYLWKCAFPRHIAFE